MELDGERALGIGHGGGKIVGRGKGGWRGGGWHLSELGNEIQLSSEKFCACLGPCVILMGRA